MNRRAWIGGLFLSLCGWAGEAGAQEVEWRPAARPAELLPPARLVVLPAGATLGRPMPAPAPDAAAPGLIAATYQVTAPPAPVPAGVIAASYQMTALPTPVPRTWTDGPSAPPAAPTTEGSLFAADRGPVRPAVFQGEPIAVTPPGVAPAEAVSAEPSPDSQPEPCAPPGDESGGLFAGGDSLMPRFYVRGEYLLWWVKKDTVPPLVTTSSPADFGFLGRPTTQVLFGGDGLDGQARSGARFTAGLWLDDCGHKAFEVSGFFLGNNSDTFSANSAQFPLLARPFFSLNRGIEFSQLTAFPGAATGSVTVNNSSNLWGMEANLRCNLCCSQSCSDDCGCAPAWNYRVDGLAGFRYLNLKEDLSIVENVANMPGPTNMLTNLGGVVFDDFATRNQFYGGQVGLDGQFGRGPWSLDVLGKLALGDTRQEVSINGGQTLQFSNGTTRNFVGGLLALPSNIGTFHKDAFSVVPEVDLTVSYHINEHWRVFAGYDLLYWTNVVRPGQQIDRVLDETLIPNFDTPGTVAPAGQNRPAVLFHESDFWAQGVHMGLEFRY